MEKEFFRPGRSKQLVTVAEAISINPDFFVNRPSDHNWILTVTRPGEAAEVFPPGTHFEYRSRFGAVWSAVVLDAEGKPSFDRPRYEESPNVNIVAWGRDKQSGQIKIALISQPRPHADDPQNPDNHESLVFAQIPMGFKEKVFGKDQSEAFESSQSAAGRETSEETGASVIKSTYEPEYPYHNPNPTFVGTWSDLVFVEVDLDKIEKLKSDRSELIYGADFITFKELAEEVKNGKTERGISRSCTSNSALFIFLYHLKDVIEKSEGIRPTNIQAIREADRLTGESIAHFEEEKRKEIEENRNNFRRDVSEIKITYRRENLVQYLNVHFMDKDGTAFSNMRFPGFVDYIGISVQDLLKIFKVKQNASPNDPLIDSFDGFQPAGKQYLSKMLGKPVTFEYRPSLYNLSLDMFAEQIAEKVA